MIPQEFIDKLPEYAEEYIKVCLDNTKEVVSGSGKLVNQRDRHIPTISFFLNIWLPFNKGQSFNRKTYYEWLKSDNENKSNTIKSIDELFTSLATDIVANEGKGIFYAKNKLGMTDKQQVDGSMTFKADFGTE
jgi:hypothetical protein